MGTNDRASSRDPFSQGLDLCLKAIDEQIKQWQAAAEKVGQLRYGPTDAMTDFQEATARSLRYAMDIARLGGVGRPSSPPDLVAEREAILRQYEGARAAVAARDAAKTASYYAPTVRQATEFAPSVEGRENVQRGFEGIFSWNDLEMEYHAEQLLLAPQGGMAWELGKMTMSSSHLPVSPWQGRYLVVWEKSDDGEWLMTVDISNSMSFPQASSKQASAPPQQGRKSAG
jgi:ketosteroid isomerase-like protein